MQRENCRQGGTAPTTQGPDAREQLFEVAVFLFLIVPSMVLSLFVLRAGTLGFVFTAFAVMLRDLALVSLILFFLWRNGEPLEQLGWTFKNGWKDVILGVGLFLPLFFGAGVLDHLLQSAGFSSPATPLPAFLAAKGGAEIILAFFLVVAVALAEETIFRGYLLLRFRGLKMKPGWAALLSAVIFSLGHGYEGSSGVVTVGGMGLAFALVYLWRRSLVAPVIMHFLQDFIGIVLVPLLGLK
ncbi:MAG: type II CAAX endopeptidase family protein [Desulfobaccales bacterium]